MDRTRDDNHKFYILDNPRLTPTWAEGPKELSDATKDLREASRAVPTAEAAPAGSRPYHGHSSATVLQLTASAATFAANSNDFPSPYFRHMQNYLTYDSRGRCYSRKLTSVNSVLTGYGRWWPFR
jgi:hypothetical protein